MMKRDGRGQALVEFALVIPLFLAIVFGIVDLGRGVWAADTAAHAASEAARFAIVHGGSANDPCPVGPLAPTWVGPLGPLGTCPHPSTLLTTSKQSIYDTATNAAIGSGAVPTVTACYGTGCTGNADIAGSTNARGTPVTVKVTIHVTLFTGALLGVSNFDVSSTATMVVNN
jgi:hypothetical protein